MIKLEFKLSTLLIGAFISGFFIGILIMASFTSSYFSTKTDKLNEQIHELRIKNTKLQDKIDSDLRLLQEIRRKNKWI